MSRHRRRRRYQLRKRRSWLRVRLDLARKWIARLVEFPSQLVVPRFGKNHLLQLLHKMQHCEHAFLRALRATGLKLEVPPLRLARVVKASDALGSSHDKP